MGNSESDQKARDFFENLGEQIQQRTDRANDLFYKTASIPSQIVGAATQFLTNPMSGLIIPIVALGGLYIVLNRK
jgi:hypothetical protein